MLAGSNGLASWLGKVPSSSKYIGMMVSGRAGSAASPSGMPTNWAGSSAPLWNMRWGCPRPGCAQATQSWMPVSTMTRGSV